MWYVLGGAGGFNAKGRGLAFCQELGQQVARARLMDVC